MSAPWIRANPLLRKVIPPHHIYTWVFNRKMQLSLKLQKKPFTTVHYGQIYMIHIHQKQLKDKGG